MKGRPTLPRSLGADLREVGFGLGSILVPAHCTQHERGQREGRAPPASPYSIEIDVRSIFIGARYDKAPESVP